MPRTKAIRYHDISSGHRVVGHENKCAFLHGHNYRVHFTIESPTGLDAVGRVLDFSLIKLYVCEWLESNWDHKFLVWCNDPFKKQLVELDDKSLYITSFNPTAENMAKFLVEYVGPLVLPKGAVLTCCRIDETRKCSVEYSL